MDQAKEKWKKRKNIKKWSSAFVDQATRAIVQKWSIIKKIGFGRSSKKYNTSLKKMFKKKAKN